MTDRYEEFVFREGFRRGYEKGKADRPKGEWEIVTQGRHSFRRCSNCKWTQTYSDPKYMGYEYNFCPNCGADMKGAGDD